MSIANRLRNKIPTLKGFGLCVLALAGFTRLNNAQDETLRSRPPATSPVPPASPAVDLRPLLGRFELNPREQGARSTCSVFTVASALEFASAMRQGHTPRLSVEFLNWAANKACGHTQDGGFFSDLWKGFATYGICAEAQMPYQAAFSPAREPSPAALLDAKRQLALGLRLHWIKAWNVETGLTAKEFVEIKRTLQQDWPVCSGLRWPKQERWVEGVLQMCPPNSVRDGHSVLLVGYRDDASEPGGGVFLFRNTSHEGMDGAMPYAYARQYMNDAVWVDYAPQPPHAVPGAARPKVISPD